MVGTSPPPGLCSFSPERRRSADVKTIRELRISVTKQDERGWMSENYPSLQPREKCFLLTSPFIEPGLIASECLEMKNRLVPLCIFAIFTPAAVAQMVVDATGPAHSRMRNPTAGHVGSIGRKLPVELRVKVGALSSDFAENHEVEFIIVNLSKEDLTIPVSPNPGDLEPADPKVSYRLKFMRLYLTTG